jgi:hypothetical protein
VLLHPLCETVDARVHQAVGLLGTLPKLGDVEDGQVAVGLHVHHGVHLQHEHVALDGGLHGLFGLLEEDAAVGLVHEVAHGLGVGMEGEDYRRDRGQDSGVQVHDRFVSGAVHGTARSVHDPEQWSVLARWKWRQPA